MSDSLLLILPLPAYRVRGQIYLDEQACYGLDLWLENFNSVVLSCPTQDCASPPAATKPIKEIGAADRLAFEALPFTYTPFAFLKGLASTSRRLSTMIDRSSHLHFAIGGFWGDWGAVSAIIAGKKKRPFAVWTDRVESSVMAFQSSTMTGVRKFYYSLNAKFAALLEKAVIKQSAVGLFNGMDCFKAYASYCKDPQLVANFNYAKGTHISDRDLASRLDHLDGRDVRFVYVGRAHKDKGIFDWIDAFSQLKGEFSATWFGDGPELEAARSVVASRGLAAKIAFPGNVPHALILEQLKHFHAFIFCHKTQESPRCLIEALACGLPIVGYKTDYSLQLITANSGGLLSPLHDVRALASSLQKILLKPDCLIDLSKAAALDGKRFNPEEAFRHRSDLIKLLKQPPGSEPQLLSII